MKVLIIGDVVGKPGRNILTDYLERKKSEYDMIVVNGENAAAGFGLTEKIAKQFYEIGVDAITSGNHIWDKKEMVEYLKNDHRILRPLNYPKGVSGVGWNIFTTPTGEKVGVVSLQGRIFMPPIDCPFQRITEVLDEIRKQTTNIIVDFHAEATSEKMAMGRFLDGKVSVVLGTHTHIQTSDSRILDGGTGYITDIGMTGSHDGIIGMTVDSVLPRFLTSLPTKFAICNDNVRINGIEVELDQYGKCSDIKRVDMSIEELDFADFL